MANVWKKIIGKEPEDYFKSWLNNPPAISNRIDKLLGKKIAIESVYALCDENTPNERLLRIDDGYFEDYISSEDYDYDRMEEFLSANMKNTENRVFICEDCAHDIRDAKAQDLPIIPYLHDKNEKYTYLYHDIRFSHIPFLLYAIRIRGVMPFIYFLDEKAPQRFFEFPHLLTTEDVNFIASHTKEIIMEAYDFESYIKIVLKHI